MASAERDARPCASPNRHKICREDDPSAAVAGPASPPRMPNICTTASLGAMVPGMGWGEGLERPSLHTAAAAWRWRRQ